MVSYFCSLWQSLLNNSSDYRNIYNDFMVQQLEVIAHIEHYQPCRELIVKVLPEGVSPPKFSSMTDDEFAKTIKKLWDFARNNITLPGV